MKTTKHVFFGQNGLQRAVSLLGVAAVTLVLAFYSAAPANATNLVTNGSFETGDFSGWAPVGNTGFTGVTCPGGAPDGSCFAFFGPVGSDGGISQDLTLTVGFKYNLSFDFSADGGTPSDFDVLVNGISLFSLSNPPASGFQGYTFSFTATAATETLEFLFRNDPGFLSLDAVQVVPEPGSMALLAIGLAALFMGLRRRVQ
jgi:hypothetical protein